MSLLAYLHWTAHFRDPASPAPDFASSCVSNGCLSASVVSNALVSLVVEKKSQTAIERRDHTPVWLLIATGEFPVMKKIHVKVGTIGHIDEWHLVFPQVVGLS